MSQSCQEKAHRVRMEVATLAKAHEQPGHQSNGDEQRYANANYAMSFTKGMDHDEDTGLIKMHDASAANVPAPSPKRSGPKRSGGRTSTT